MKSIQEEIAEDFTILTFRMTYSTSFGEAVYIIGSSEWLGQWESTKALRMMPLKTTQSANECMWELSVSILNSKLKDFEYKYFLGPYHYSIIRQWEKCSNRICQFQTPASLHITMMDQWDQKLPEKQRIREIEPICPICLEGMNSNELLMNKCHHSLCRSCFECIQLTHKLHLGCSICRTSYQFSKLLYY